MGKVILDKRKIEEGLNELIEIQLRLMEILNNSSAYREDECEERLQLIRKRDNNDYILKYLFDLQSFEYTKKDFDGVIIE